MLNFGPLTAEIFWRVWGTSANFNGFCILASLLHRRRLTAANQTLHNVWPSPGMVHYIYIFGGSCPLTEFCQLQNSLCVQVFRSPILAALLHGTRAAGVIQRLRRGIQGMELRNVRKRRHLYSEGRPSCWVSAHILAYSSNGILFYLFRLFKVFLLIYWLINCYGFLQCFVTVCWVTLIPEVLFRNKWRLNEFIWKTVVKTVCFCGDWLNDDFWVVYRYMAVFWR